ncbi:hypothetical protein ACRC7T_18940 [Segnochrobactraceae bacterium EtOH-i3]
MSRVFDVAAQRRPDGRWSTDALSLPSARLLSVRDETGTSLPFHSLDGQIDIGLSTPSSLTGRIEVSDDLVRSSVIDEAKLKFEADKAASLERQTRLTLVTNVITAVISAAAALGVAALAGGRSAQPSPSGPPHIYRDLAECRDGLNSLKTLALLDQQTLPDLRTAVGGRVNDCLPRLSAAMAATPQ